MNSQTLRIIWGNGNISDYNITDGTTASKFMKIVGGETPTQATFGEYKDRAILNEDDEMSWGTDTDKMTGIEFTDVGGADVNLINGDNRMDRHGIYDSYGFQTTITSRRASTGIQFYQPIRKPVKQTPPPPRYDYSKTKHNDDNFKKLFGK